MASDYLYLHGELYLSDRTSGGEPDNFVKMPNTSDIELSLESTDLEHTDKSNAIASLDLSIPYMQKASGKIIVDSSLALVVAQALFGEQNAVAGGAFVAGSNAFPSGLSVGDIMPLPNGRTHVSSLVLTDSTGAPVTLTLGTHYEIVSADGGLIKILSLTGLTQPLKAAGTEAAGIGVGIFEQRTSEKYARFVGINIADDDAIKVIDWYRMQFSPTGTWKVMGTGSDVQMWELPFRLLKDQTKTASSAFGYYGRYRTDA